MTDDGVGPVRSACSVLVLGHVAGTGQAGLAQVERRQRQVVERIGCAYAAVAARAV